MNLPPQRLIRIVSDKRVLAAAALVALALLTAGYLYARHSSTRQFAVLYGEYATLAQAQEDAAYLPAAPNNPVREELNLALTETLDSSISAAQRLQDARQGLVLLKELDAEIDAIADASDKANALVAQMQVESVDDFATIAATGKLLDLIKQRSSIVEDIRGLSYRSDFDTAQIFQHIVSVNGQLTAAYIAELNSEIPGIETEFDQRSDLYSQLQSVGAQIDQEAAALGSGFPAPATTP